MKKLLLVLFLGFTSLFAFEELTVDNFDQKIKNKNVVVDFYASWWGACKVLGKNLTKYNASLKPDNVEIYKVNIETQKELSKRFKINALPILIYFKDEKQVAKEAGVKSPEQLQKKVTEYLQ